MAGRGVYRHVVHADAFQFAGKETGASAQILAVMGMGAHAGYAEEVLQTLQGPGPLGLQVGYDVFHGPRFRS